MLEGLNQTQTALLHLQNTWHPKDSNKCPSGKMPFRCKPCNFYPKNVGILKIHIHATLGKSHLDSNIAIFIQKNIGIQRIHMNATLGKSHLCTKQAALRLGHGHIGTALG